MQNEISMGDLMNAIKTLETNNNHASQVLDEKFTKSTQNLEARLNSTTGELMQAIMALDNKFTLRFDQTDSEIAEIHEALQIFSDATDEQFRSVDQRFDQHFINLEGQLNLRFTRIESQMVTKDYLDEKMGGLRGDMIQRIRTGLPKLAL